jgi:hypothetical protein
MFKLLRDVYYYYSLILLSSEIGVHFSVLHSPEFYRLGPMHGSVHVKTVCVMLVSLVIGDLL